ncbi:MAG: hypothetical protein WCY89_05155 [Flavobacteriaceae bacterium]
MKKRIINRILTAVFFVTANLAVWADPLPTPAPSFFPVNPDGGEDDPAGAPIDSAILWLFVVGIFLAVYYLIKFRNKIHIKN